jgi:hypothetical protein
VDILEDGDVTGVVDGAFRVGERQLWGGLLTVRYRVVGVGLAPEPDISA